MISADGGEDDIERMDFRKLGMMTEVGKGNASSIIEAR
jgi:hypothetical protein